MPSSEEQAALKARKEAKVRLKQLPELPTPHALPADVPTTAIMSAAASGAAPPLSAAFDIAEQYAALIASDCF